MPKTLRVCARGIRKRVLFIILAITISGVSYSKNGSTTENLNNGIALYAWDFPMQVNGIIGYTSMKNHVSGVGLFQVGKLPPLCNPCNIFDAGQAPGAGDGPQKDADGLGTTWGVKFKASTDGYISGIRFYKAVGDTAHNSVQLWTLDGFLLASAQMTSTPTPGWSVVSFANAPVVTAGTVYIASYYSSTGWYDETNNQFSVQVTNTNGTLTALADGDPTGANVNGNQNGLWEKTPPNFMPGNGDVKSNYWVDVAFVDANLSTIQPSIVDVSPDDGSTGVDINTSISVTFNKNISAATVTNTSFFLKDPSNNLIPATLSYTSGSRTAKLIPSASLNFSTIYTVTVKGGSTGITDPGGLTLLGGDDVWSFTTELPPPPPLNDGGGGPVLIISNVANPFSRYFTEVLRSEGYNGFLAIDISTLTAGIINNYDVVILGQIKASDLSSGALTILTNWVNAGGTLIVMRPDVTNLGLMSLLGITPTGSTLSDKYLLVNTTGGMPGAGIVNQTMQYHGTADLYTLSGATALATLYSSASTPTPALNPAVSTINVGSSGGKAIAFSFDLAKSGVYTRQGNPALAGVSGDGIHPIRSYDLFGGTVANSYNDFSKIQIPQADEQQHLLTNIILLDNLHRKPMPHVWFLPSGFKAAVVMTGDDHDLNFYPGSSGTAGRFNQYRDWLLPGVPNTQANIDDWKTIRGTSYLFASTALRFATTPTDSINYYLGLGFEIALHPYVIGAGGCVDFTSGLTGTLDATITAQWNEMHSDRSNIPMPVTNRTHCLPWSDWSTHPLVEFAHGMRLDENYYYTPAAFVLDRPGMLTGSGQPMRFADVDGTIIDVYQSPTVITDESGQTIPVHIKTLIDNATGPNGYYGAFSMNMHTDTAIHIGSNQIVTYAVANGIPVVSAKQMLTWLDNRNNTTFGPMTWVNNKTLSFTVTTIAHNLQALVPTNSSSGSLLSITKNGSPVTFTTQTIKGISYAFFDPTVPTLLPTSIVATYSSTALPVTLINFKATKQGDNALLNWTTTMEENNKGFGIQRSVDGSAWDEIGFVNGAGNSQTLINYQYLDKDLSAGTYYYRLRQVDLDGREQISKVVQVVFEGLALELKQNRPNPVSSTTTIDIVVPKTGRVQLALYDQFGRLVQQLMDEYKAPGTYSILVNRNGMNSGIYYYRMNALGQTITRKMTIF
jgi:hypothetical protein